MYKFDTTLIRERLGMTFRSAAQTWADMADSLVRYGYVTDRSPTVTVDMMGYEDYDRSPTVTVDGKSAGTKVEVEAGGSKLLSDPFLAIMYIASHVNSADTTKSDSMLAGEDLDV